MAKIWTTFSTDICGSFNELSGNIIYNLNKYKFNGNLIDTTSNFLIYYLKDFVHHGDILQETDWDQIDLTYPLSPFQGYWLGGISLTLPQIFMTRANLSDVIDIFINDQIPIVNKYGEIEDWDVTNVTNMEFMFSGKTTFNQNLNEWNVSNVTNMYGMFAGAVNFTGNISSWNVSNVTNMNSMFYYAQNFNGNISNWIVANVTNMENMFDGATSFNQNISSWDVTNVTNMNRMFYNTPVHRNNSDKIDSNGTPHHYFINQGSD